ARHHRAGPCPRRGHRRRRRRAGYLRPLPGRRGRLVRLVRRGPCRTAPDGTACSSGSAGDRRDADPRTRRDAGRRPTCRPGPGRRARRDASRRDAGRRQRRRAGRRRPAGRDGRPGRTRDPGSGPGAPSPCRSRSS
ncbi:MAG TPA: hypothetical protein VK284_09745, partial [Streptosporangiaceae bacterium]|nr:hypothetical protein [Streptosporangiaceae bacterium]